MNNTNNPFYRNYVFTKQDLDRATIKWWHRLYLLFKPIKVQIVDSHVIRFKATADGKLFIFGWEQLQGDKHDRT